MIYQESEEFKPQLLQLAISNTYMLVLAINYTKDSYTVIHSTTPFINNAQQGVFSLFSMGYIALFHPDDRLDYPLLCDLDTLVYHLSNNNGSYTFEFRFQNSLMEYHWYEGTYVKMEAPDTSDINLLLLIKDIDEKKRIKENLNDALAASIVCAKAKTNFFSRMSHDIRTPLRVITEMKDIIKNNIDDKEKIIESLAKIEVSSKYLTQLIDNVLEMSDIEAGELMILNAPFSLVDLFKKIDFTYSEKAKLKEIDFNATLGCQNHPTVIGDEARITQVIDDLLSNTYKYVSRGSEISFEIKLDKVVYNRAFYTFIIESNGEVIAGQLLDQIFDPFAQVESSHEEISNESILGLSICKNIVELLGGHISATSNDKEGGIRFEVYISFELPEERALVNVPQSAEKSFVTFSQKTVLVVESNYATYGVIKSLLEGRGVTVDLAINGLDAVEIFENSTSHNYDLILMDIEMPVMTGFDSANAIRNSSHDQSQTIPIIAMTTNTFAEDLAMSISAGINDCILKPINADKLFSTLNKYL